MYRIYTAILIPIIFLASAAIAYGLYRLCSRKGQPATRLLFLLLSLVFVGLETSKQIYEFCRPEGYSLYSIPLHVCSFFVFFPIFAACLKQEWRITRVLWALSANCALIVTLAMLVYPEIIIGLQAEAVLKATGSYLEYHSVTHHALIVLYTLLLLFFKPWKPNRGDCLWAGCIFGGFLLLAWVMANALNTDFSSFLRIGNGFFQQLLVWLLHMLCFGLSSVLLVFAARARKKQPV